MAPPLLPERADMRAFSQWILTLFASPLGIVVLAALDSTLFFSLPFGIDAAVVILAARLGQFWWIVPLLATFGSVAGAALTFWMGVKIGEKGLHHWVAPTRLNQVRRRVRTTGAIALAVLDLIPPPFPFTPFVLAAGALKVKPRTFFVTLIVVRLFRFGVEAALAAVYGRNILSWMDSDLFQEIVVFFIVVAIVLTTVSLVRLARSTHPFNRRRATV
jgi:membrane protein YqaA with SNARE-associated domain